MLQLRDYQLELINGVYESISKGNKRIMVQSPAGSGKSVTMSEIARRATVKKNRVLFVVHRRELVSQIKGTFAANDVDFDYCHVGMVQTVNNQIKKGKIRSPSIILVDEAHHSLAKTYMNIFDAFPDAYVLGFTATPWRMSNQGFTEVFQDLILGKSVKWLIKNNRLAPFKYYSVNLTDVKKLKKNSTGDFSKDSIDKALGKTIFGDVVENYKKLANGKKTIVYTHSVEASKKVAEKFNSAGYNSMQVDGKTNKLTRLEAMEKFRSGEVTILVNAELYGEGVDVPDCECVILVRPTESLTLFIQQSMRSMRYMPGKEAIIIDHVGNCIKHGLPTTDYDWKKHFKGGKKQAKAEVLIKECVNCFAVYPKEEDECPLCGHKVEIEEVIGISGYEVVEEVVLKEVTEEEITLDFREPSDCKSMKELIELGKNRGYKNPSGWAYYQAKHYGLI